MHPIIRHMFKLRGMADPLIAPVALGASSGQITFTDDTSNPGASFITPTSASTPAGPSTGLITYPVRIQTLDEMVHELKLPKVDYIKCDAEGFDLDVLRGSMQTIRRHKPRLALCTYHKPNHYDEMKSLLSGLGYTIQGKGLFNAGDKLHVLMLHAWQT
jgi:FkbM family methyltransferase